MLGEDEEVEDEHLDKNESYLCTKKLRKMGRVKACSKANFNKLTLFEKNLRLIEMSKEIKQIKA
jgi:hypothetical protein